MAVLCGVLAEAGMVVGCGECKGKLTRSERRGGGGGGGGRESGGVGNFSVSVSKVALIEVGGRRCVRKFVAVVGVARRNDMGYGPSRGRLIVGGSGGAGIVAAGRRCARRSGSLGDGLMRVGYPESAGLGVKLGVVPCSRGVLLKRKDLNYVMAEQGILVDACSSLTAELLNDRDHQAKEWAHQPRRIALFVEPSPFAYVSGYKNRFQNFIRYLREMGDEVLVVTTHKGVPTEFYGAKVIGSWSFPCPWYTVVPLSLALSPRIFREVSNFKPDLIHASSPGIMVFGALAIAKMLSVPIVMSYHTHVPLYIPKYTFSWLVKPMWWVITFLHRAADFTLVMSHALGKELKAAGAAAAEKIGVWSKGIDTEVFNPRFKSHEMRLRLTHIAGQAATGSTNNGKPEMPLIVHVGRLGAEKNLDFLKLVMDRLPGVRLAFVGDGPYRKVLERVFNGMNVTFTGMLQGEELSQAYASGDIFITPSESETLGFVVLEAMASRVSVVCARARGITDIVQREGETGFLYTPGDVDDCTGKIKALLEAPELRERIALAGREDVENYDWRASTKQVRNEQYTAAVWFWHKKKQQLANRFFWWRQPQLSSS